MKRAVEKDINHMEKNLAFWIISIAVLIIVGIGIIAARDHDNLYSSLKAKVELEGEIEKINYSAKGSIISFRNLEDDLQYSISIDDKLTRKRGSLKIGQSIRIKGFLPDRYKKRIVTAHKIEIIK